MQDAAVAVVADLDRCVDAAGRDKSHDRAVGLAGDDLDGLLLFQVVVEGDFKFLGAVQAERLAAFAFAELQREHSHADQIRAVNSFERGGDDGSNAEQVRPLGRPVAGRAGAVFRSGENDQRCARSFVILRGFVNRGLLPGGVVGCDAAFRTGSQQVSQADVAERAASHHAVVAAAAAVAVEVGDRDAVFLKVGSGGGVRLDRSSRADVVRRGRVTDRDQTTCAFDRGNRRRFVWHVDEEGRLLHVGAGLVPFVDVAHAAGNRLPLGRTIGGLRVLLDELIRAHRIRDGRRDLFLARPDITQHDVVAVRVLSQRLGGEVDVCCPGEGIGHDERRACQVVRFDERIDTAFEVAVAREHGRDDQVARIDGFCHRDWQRSAVSDARRAAVPDCVKTKSFQVVGQSRLFQVLRDDSASRREAGFDPRLLLETFRDGVSSHQAGTDHD